MSDCCDMPDNAICRKNVEDFRTWTKKGLQHYNKSFKGYPIRNLEGNSAGEPCRLLSTLSRDFSIDQH